jgi:tetratricopeptide (TPR) repeat protein
VQPTDSANSRLRSARQALGLRSQQALAEAVTRAGAAIGLRISVTARTVRRWESAQPPWPHPDHQAALESLFQRSLPELGFAPPWTDEPPESADPTVAAGGRMRERAGGSIQGGPVPMMAARARTAWLPGPIAADYITVTTAHRHMYWVVPAATLHGAVSAHASLGAALLPSVPESARRAFAAAVAESSLLTGRIEFFDLQRPAAAQASLVNALQAAQEARDPVLAAAVLGHMAFIPAFSGDPVRADEAREKIRAAKTFARRGSAAPEVMAWLGAVEAEVETRLGNAGMALRLIRDAEDVLSTAGTLPVPPWLDWFSPARLAGFKGNTLMVARRPAQARAALQEALDQLPPESAKQRSVLLADLAAVAVSEQDPERACLLAEEALEQLGKTWYATGMDRIRALRQALGPWESQPCVHRLDERLYDWTTTFAALTG